jgi:hypothetical protein
MRLPTEPWWQTWERMLSEAQVERAQQAVAHQTEVRKLAWRFEKTKNRVGKYFSRSERR